VFVLFPAPVGLYSGTPPPNFTKFVSSTIAEPYPGDSKVLDVPEVTWLPGTTYTPPLYRQYERKNYKLISSGSITTSSPPPTDPTNWVAVGPSNRWAMFDGSLRTRSADNSTVGHPSKISIELQSINADAVALFGVIGEVTIFETQLGGGSNLTNIGGSGAINIYRPVAGNALPAQPVDILYVSPLSPASNPSTTWIIDIGYQDGRAECAAVLPGVAFRLGDARLGAKVSIIDYSLKNTDEFGQVSFVRRPASKRVGLDLFVPGTNVTKLQTLLTDLRATPTAWFTKTGVSSGSQQAALGYFKDFSVVCSYQTLAQCSLEIEGLT
jgi:hypothetical protein